MAGLKLGPWRRSDKEPCVKNRGCGGGADKLLLRTEGHCAAHTFYKLQLNLLHEEYKGLAVCSGGRCKAKSFQLMELNLHIKNTVCVHLSFYHRNIQRKVNILK